MRRVLLAALVLAAAACREEAPAPSPPVSWSVTAAVDKKEVQVGEDLTLTLTVTHPDNGSFIAPPEAVFTPFDVLSRSEEKVSPTETRLLYRLAAFRLPAELEIPAVEVPYREEGGELKSLKTDPIPVRVVTSLTPEVTDIHDIKDPVDLEVPRDLRLLFWLLAALLAAVVAYLIYRKLRREPEAHEAPAWTPPPLPPDVEAERALGELRDKKLPERGELLAFYTELSEIVKRYVGRRYEVPWLERTTSEVLSDLRPKKVPPHVLAELRAILDASDLVKFAKLVPEVQKAEKSLDSAFRLVAVTRPAVPAPMEATA
jgi:hypothetical protein